MKRLLTILAAAAAVLIPTTTATAQTTTPPTYDELVAQNQALTTQVAQLELSVEDYIQRNDDLVNERQQCHIAWAAEMDSWTAYLRTEFYWETQALRDRIAKLESQVKRQRELRQRVTRRLAYERRLWTQR
jgi:hypothetical protein